MKKNILIIFLFLFFSSIHSFDFNIFLRFSAAASQDIFLSREIAVENYHHCINCPLQCSFVFLHESFDNIVWGITNRLSLKCNLLFGDKNNFFLKIGPGIGFATSYGFSSFSPDIYCKLYCWLFFIFADTSIYSDGVFNKNGIGIEFKLWEILFDMGLSNIISTDYEYSVFKLRFEIGAGYEF